MRRLYPYIGITFTIAGFLHILISAVLFPGPVREIIADGVFNAIWPAYDRLAAFWYFYTGVVMMFAGYLLHWILYIKRLRLPRTAGWLMILLALIGIVFIPYGGFWVAILQGLVLAFPKV